MNVTSLPELLRNHWKFQGAITVWESVTYTALGLGRHYQDCSSPKLLPTSWVTFWAAGNLDGLWISVFQFLLWSRQGEWEQNLFSKSLPIYECSWFQTHWIFTHWEEMAIPQTALGSKEASDPEAALWLQPRTSHGHLCSGPPIPVRQPDLRLFSALLLYLRIWTPI